MKKIISALVFLAAAQVQAADVEWSGWSFNYSTNNNASGLVLTDVAYNDKKILGKVSMPVMRVEYENDVCGPYADILSSGALRDPGTGAQIEACANQAVCRRTFTQNGENMLEIGANWQIGEYQIYQTYYFSEEGYFDSRVYSRGLQCQIQHGHHGQWMFDFDIDGAANDQIAKNADDIQTTEFNDLKANTSYWTIQDKVTGSKVRLTPSSDDGEPDNFSKWDLAGRAFVSDEVGVWRYGARGEIGNLFNTPAQSIDGTDLVLWYVSHLPHSPEEGASIWHASGPRLSVLDGDNPPEPETEPEPEPETEPEPENGSVLVNGGFESTDLTGWNNCGSASNVGRVATGQAAGSGAVSVSGGGCLYQEATAMVDDQYELTCAANRSDDGWTIIELSYLDANFENLFSDVEQVNQQAGYRDYSVSGTAPAGTAYVAALLYSESNTIYDSCSLVSGSGNPEVEPETPDNNLLTNGDFESNLAAWNPCAASNLTSVSSDADSGAAALAVKNQGCMFQEFPIVAGNTYSMECRAKSEDTARYTSISLTLMNAEYAAVDNAEIPVTASTFANVTAQLTAPANSRFGSVVVYSEDIGTVDNCVVTSD